MRSAKASKAPAPFKGGMWAVLDEESGKNMVGLKLANVAGNAWVSHKLVTEDLMVVSTSGAITLKNNTVTAANMVASEGLSAKAAQFIEIETGQITWNNAVGNNAFIDTLTGKQAFWDRLHVKGAITVGGPNQVGTTMIANNAITTAKIYTGAVDATKIKTGALDAFQITSPLIQSVATANRGIKWNGNQLVAYNNSGDEMIRLEGDTGEINGVTITGSTMRTAKSGLRAVMAPGNTAGAGLWFFDDTNAAHRATFQITGTHAGVWFRNRWGGTTASLTSALSTNDDFALRFHDDTDTSETGQLRMLIGSKPGTATGVRMLMYDKDGQWRVWIDDAAAQGIRVRNPGNNNIGRLTGGGLYLGGLASGSGGFNIRMNSSYSFFYESSARATKMSIEPLDETVPDEAAILDLEPVTFLGRPEMEKYVDGLEKWMMAREQGSTEIPEKPSMPTRTPGLILEDLVDAGLEEFTLPGPVRPDGTQDAGTILYDKAWLPLIPLVRDLAARIKTLEERTS